MGRIEKTEYPGGTYIREYVDKVPAIKDIPEENRAMVYLPDTPVQKLMEIGGATFSIMVGRFLDACAERFGEEVYDIAEQVAYDVGIERAPAYQKMMNIDDVNDARALGRIADAEGCPYGMASFWPDPGKKHGVMRAINCTWAPGCVKHHVIHRICEAMDKGTIMALGGKVKAVTMPKAIPDGDPYCELEIEMED